MNKKKYFLRLLALVFIPAALFPRCGKKNSGDSPGDGYYVNFTVGGTSYSFRGNPYASLSQSGGIYITGIGSFKDQATGTRNVVSVSIGKLSPLKEGDSFSGLFYPPEGAQRRPCFLLT